MRRTIADALGDLCKHGFVLVRGVFAAEAVAGLRRAVAEIANGHVHNGRTYAARNLLGIPAIAELARSRTILDLVTPAILRADSANRIAGVDRARQAEPPTRVRAVRGLLFNKVAEANWAVPWHQDLTIAVRERREAPGFGPWSVKDGMVHVQPPEEIIAGMLAVRIHLDDTDAANGALRVIPGSHTAGRLSAASIAEYQVTRAAVTVEAPAGSVLLMRPHLLHASSPAKSPFQRRVIHLEYSADELPFGLEWNIDGSPLGER